jgi:hypothetical protein
MPDQPLEPCELVIELWPGLWIAVRQVKRNDDDVLCFRFQISSLTVGRIARQATSDLFRCLAFRQNGDAMVRALTMPDRSVACVADRFYRELGVVGFDFLQTNDVGTVSANQSSKRGRRPLTPLTL